MNRVRVRQINGEAQTGTLAYPRDLRGPGMMPDKKLWAGDCLLLKKKTG